MADAAGDGRRAVNPPRPGADVAAVSAAGAGEAVSGGDAGRPAGARLLAGDRRSARPGVQLALGLFRQPACRPAYLYAGGAMAKRQPSSRPADPLSPAVIAGRSSPALRHADLSLRTGDVYCRQRGGNVLPATRHRDGAGGHWRPDGAVVAGLVCRHHLYRQVFQPLRAAAAGDGRLPATGGGDPAAAAGRCAQPAGAVDSGLYADGRRRQLMQQHRAKQRFPAYACRRDA